MTIRMQGYDALLWEIEVNPLLHAGIVAVIVLDGPPDEAALTERLTEMVAGIPQLRATPKRRPRPLAPTRWEDSPDIDVRDHLSRHSADGDGDALGERIAQLTDRRYGGGSPLWWVEIITELPEDRAAVLFGLHHSLSDGIGAMLMAARFFDADASGKRLIIPPEEEPVPPREDSGRTALPTDITQSVREDLTAAASLGARVLHTLPAALSRSLQDPRGAVSRSVEFAESLARLMAPADEPLSTLMTERSGKSSFRLIEFPIDDLRRAAHSQGGRVNDAYLCALALGLRRYHEDAGHSVAEIRMSMPVSYRPADSSSAGGNEFTPVRLRLPLTAREPVEGMRLVRERLAAARGEPAVSATPVLTEVLARLPTPATLAVVSSMFTSTDLSATNVPGPPMTLWCARRRVEELYAVAPRVGMGLCTALFTYAGTATITVNADTGAVPDPDRMLACLQSGVDEVLALGR